MSKKKAKLHSFPSRRCPKYNSCFVLLFKVYWRKSFVVKLQNNFFYPQRTLKTYLTPAAALCLYVRMTTLQTQRPMRGVRLVLNQLPPNFSEYYSRQIMFLLICSIAFKDNDDICTLYIGLILSWLSKYHYLKYLTYVKQYSRKKFSFILICISKLFSNICMYAYNTGKNI